MQEIKAPKIYDKKPNENSLFMAGGISNCSDWQKDFKDLLKNEDIVLLNPRRDDWDKINPEKQIKWEFDHFQKATAVSFWFCHETLCPITLYELGKESAINIPLFVGIDPEYKRKLDVEVQSKLIRPNLKIVYTLEDLSKQIKDWLKKR